MKVLYLTLIVFITDQISKLVVKGFSIPFLHFNWVGMDYGESINIIGTFLRITFVENPGMAFGLDVGVTQKLFLSIFTILATVGILYYLYKSRERSLSLRIGLALILAGALGNMIDRIFYGVIFNYAPLMYGRVVDFIQVEFWDFTLFGNTYETWPIFNVADSAVTIGVAVILLFYREKNVTKDVTLANIDNNHSIIKENTDSIKNGEDNNRESISV